MPWVAICERARPGMGRNLNQTYVNVVKSTRQIAVNAATFVAQNPTHPWADSGENEFIVDLTDQEAADIRNGIDPLFHNGLQNQPRWQQNVAGSGSTKSFGFFADPTSAASAFTAGTPLSDDRWIVRVYTEDPVANPGTAIHVVSEEFDEAAAGSSAERFIRLFTAADVASGTNAGNQRTEIGGKLIDFDFGSSDGLSAGVARIRFATDVSGFGVWSSNHRYRLIGPSGETEYRWNVYGKVLRIPQE